MSAPQHYDDIPMSWVGDTAGRRAMLSPRAEAIVDSASNKRYTFADMNDRANRVATYLRDVLRLKKGDVISFIGRNTVEAIDLYLAIGKLGVILSPLSYRLGVPEINELMQRTQPKAFFYDSFFSDLVGELEFPESVATQVKYGDDAGEYEKVLATEPLDCNIPLSLSDTFLYVHTGGTTAVPKVCLVSYRQMQWNTFEILAAGALGGVGMVELLTFPFFHVGGWNTFHPIFTSGGKCVLLRDFDPGRLLELIEQEKVVHFGGVEAMLQFITAHPNFEKTDLSSLKLVNTAGAPCAPEVMEPFFKREIPVCQVYGLTEAGPSNFGFTPVEMSLEEIKAKATSIGHPMYHTDFKLVDPDTKEEVAQGEEGVLCFKSAHNFSGYLNDPERTKKLFLEGGWIYTGDLAKADEEGFIYIRGRADNMYISGGENVSPEEIEQALMKHDAVAQAICTGVKDDKWGQVGLAQVVLKQGEDVSEDQLIAHCKTVLATFKVPRYLSISDSIPLTGAGKLDRNALIKSFEAETA